MTNIGKYVVLRELGRGGMGVVYEARDPALDRPVALKLVNERGDPKRFLIEARAAAKVIHPNCVPIFDVGEHEGSPFLVMELVSGVTASEFLERRGTLRWKTATRIVSAACRGLSAVHDAGLVHRDVKPSNLLISKAGAVKIADFGLARVVGKSVPTLTGDQAVGTPHYMSPEQCWNETVDARSDIYALGATYFVLLTGRPPYHADLELQIMFAHCNDPVPDPRNVAPDTPAACAEVVRKAMAKAPADRYQTAREMLADLEAILTTEKADPPPPSPNGDTPHPRPDAPTMKGKRSNPSTPGEWAREPGMRGEKTPVETAQKTPLNGTRTGQRTELRREQPTPLADEPATDTRLTRRRWLLGLPVALAALGAGGYFAFRKQDHDDGAGVSPPPPPPSNQPPILVPVREVGGAVGVVGGVAVTDDGRWLAVALNDKSDKARGVKLFDRSLGHAPEVWWHWQDEPCEAVAFSPDGNWLAVATSVTGKMRLWNMAEKQEADIPASGFHHELRGTVFSVAFSPNNKLLAASVAPFDEARPCFARVWDMVNQTHLRDLKADKQQPIRGISFASDSKTLVGAMRLIPGAAAYIEVWEATTGNYSRPIEKIPQAITGPCVAFARNEPLLAYSCLEGVELARPRAFVPGRRFSTNNNEPAGIALSPDGSLIAYSALGGIQVWETETGRGRTEFKGQAENIYSMTFTADGKTLISGSSAGTVCEWVIPPPPKPLEG
jgi:serine/threonine protein kinase/WD40 repeat protein